MMHPEVKTHLLSSFDKGWLVGDFKPALVESSDLEICLKFFSAGEKEELHYQLIATEYTIVVSGSCVLAGRVLHPGDILEIPPLVAASFEALTDVAVIGIKTPSVPGDKVEGSPE